MQPQKTSCLARLVTSGVMYIISLPTGGLVVLLIRLLYPSINPALNSLLSAYQIPFSPDILWAFWALVPCLVSLGFSVLLSLAFNAIRFRKKNIH
jgi:hypothetical protein